MTQREFPSHPLVGIGGVVVDDRGRVLLIQRGTEPRKGHWSIPGGLLDLGETLVDGVRREISEETGLSVKPEAIIEVVDRIYKESDENGPDAGLTRVRYHYVIMDYWCTVLAGEARPASDAADLAWISRHEWLESNRYGLESITIHVIEKGWQMARMAGVHG